MGDEENVTEYLLLNPRRDSQAGKSGRCGNRIFDWILRKSTSTVISYCQG